MSRTYTFFVPTRLPLTPDALSEDTVRSFTDLATVRSALGAHLAGLAWDADPDGALARGTVSDGDAVHELTVLPYDGAEDPAPAPTLVVSLRCSGRVDSAPFVQRLCDATGWIAFDDRVYLFQPHQPAVPGGGG